MLLFTLLILYELRMLSQHCCPLTAFEHSISMEANMSSTGPSVSSWGVKLSTLMATDNISYFFAVNYSGLYSERTPVKKDVNRGSDVFKNVTSTYSFLTSVETPLKNYFVVFSSSEKVCWPLAVWWIFPAGSHVLLPLPTPSKTIHGRINRFIWRQVISLQRYFS